MQKEYNPLEDKYEDYLKEFSDCRFCKHYLGDGACDAFPEVIPIDIADGEFNHHFPHENDDGIMFEVDLEKVRKYDKRFAKYQIKQ
jgi:hypothetical protein